MKTYSRTMSAMVVAMVSALLSPVFVACDGSDMASSGSGAGGGASSSTSGQSNSSGGGVACPAGTICLDVKLLEGPTVAGRVAVLWYQLDNGGPHPTPLVAYDAPFDPTATRVEIPLSAIALPDDPNLFCPRACTDEAMCPCLSDPKLGIGGVIVAKDDNKDGKLDAYEATNFFYGTGFMATGYSATAQASLPAPFSGTLPEGVDKGVRPYRILKGSNMGLDAMGRSQDGAVFDLNVCPDALGTCHAPEPKLSSG